LQHVEVEARSSALPLADDGSGRKPTPSAHTDFSDAVMRNTRLVRADLRKATLAGADLGGADLSGADLRGANLNGAVLVEAVMESTHFAGEDLKDALNDEPAGPQLSDLDAPLPELLQRHERWVASKGHEGEQLDLSGFDLRSAPPLAGAELAALRANDSVFFGLDLSGIGLQAAQLDGADLRSCNLQGADLRGISLKGARLTNANLRGCRLGALVVNDDHTMLSRLDKAILRNADLRGADLSRAVLRGADLTNANLLGAVLDDAEIEGAQLAGTMKTM
jgi:uncharacterized protein YjbI with pentapeptide repeats